MRTEQDRMYGEMLRIGLIRAITTASGELAWDCTAKGEAWAFALHAFLTAEPVLDAFDKEQAEDVFYPP